MQGEKKKRNFIGSSLKRLQHPITTFKSLSNNGKLIVYLIVLLLFISLFSLIFILSNKDELRESTTVNDFETQLSTLTPIGATITRIEGNVQHKTATGEWEDATQELAIATEDEIKTEGAASRTVVTFENGSELRLDGDTHIRIDASTEEKIESFMIKGKTYSRVAKDSTPYSVKSEDADYEALGTVFVAEASGDKQSLEVIESSVIETTTNTTIDQGNRYIVKSAVNPSDSKKIEKIDINTYKNDSFIEWNLSIDKNNDFFKNALGILQDTEAPEITITSPTQDEVILTDPTSDTGSVTIKGKATGAVSIVITAKSVSGSPQTTVDVQQDGSFTSPAITSPLGLAVFEIEAKDRVGNTATTSLRVTIQQKSAPVEDNSEEPLLLLKSTKSENNSVSLTWYMSKPIKVENVRILYSKDSKTNNPTLTNNDGVWTPNESLSAPGTITDAFDSGGLDNETYYFRICELDEGQNECITLSNTQSVVIE